MTSFRSESGKTFADLIYISISQKKSLFLLILPLIILVSTAIYVHISAKPGTQISLFKTFTYQKDDGTVVKLTKVITSLKKAKKNLSKFLLSDE